MTKNRSLSFSDIGLILDMYVLFVYLVTEIVCEKSEKKGDLSMLFIAFNTLNEGHHLLTAAANENLLD